MASCLTNLQSILRQLISYRIWWLVLVSIAGLCTYTCYDSKVFPSASINLKVPKIEIIRSAKQLANKFEYDPIRAIESTEFSLDSEAKTFLEYEFGIDQANALMQNELPIWFWRTRFCKEHQQEEFHIWLNTSGKLVSFNHELENDKAVDTITRPEALDLAKIFIQKNTNISLTSYDLIKNAACKQAHRTDYAFTWQDNSHDYHGAKLRARVGITGNQVSQFNYYLYVPESFQRKFSTLRSSNRLLQSIASIFYSLLQVGSVFIFFWAVATKRIRWHFAIITASILTFIDLLDSFNEISSVIDSYNTETIFAGYLLQFIIECGVSCITTFLSSLALAGSAEFIYRISYPKKIALENLCLQKSYRTKSFINGIFIGHLLVGINLGWIMIYYLLGTKWHVWCPLGVENYQLLSTVVPFFSAISTGISASLNEELLYRVLALGLFQRLTKSFWLANLFQALAWGFMHSNYPQEPAFARGLELTAIGLMSGWIVRRFGLLPCLVGHYLFDALISVKMFFGANDLALRSTAIIPLIPFASLLALALYRLKKWGYRNEKPLQNRSLIATRPPKNLMVQIKDELKYVLIPQETMSYIKTLSKKALLPFILFALINMALIPPFLNYQSVNRDVKLSINRSQITSLARDELRRRKIDVHDYTVLTTLIDDTNSLDMQYVYEKTGLQQTLFLSKATKQGILWKVRFFKPLDPNEFIVWMDSFGKFLTFTLVEPEEIAGAKLSEQAARHLAESYLKRNLPEWQPLDFENSFENKRKARTDYTLTYTVSHLKVPDAEFKVSVNVVGDTVSSMESGYDLPDRWLNERNKKTFKDEAFSYLRTIFKVIMSLAVLIWAFALLKKGFIKWQMAYFGAVSLIVFSFLQHLNSLPELYRSYLTTEPLYSFMLRQFTSYVQILQSSFLYNFCSCALATAALQTVAPEFKFRSFIAFLFSSFHKQTSSLQKSIVLNSWLIAATIVVFHTFINVFADFLHIKFSPGCPLESLDTICDLSNMAWPSLAILVDALLSGITQMILVAVLVGMYKRYCNKFWLCAVFIVVFNLITHSSTRYWQDYMISVVSSSTWEIAMGYFIVKFIGVNPLTYFLVGFIDALLTSAVDLLQHGNPLFIVPIIISALFIFIPIYFVMYLWYLENKNKKAISISV